MEVKQVEPEFQEVSFESEAYKANWNQLDEVEKIDIEMPVDEIMPLLYRGGKGYSPCNNLQIKFLNNLMVKSVALQIQGYPIEEIRKIFKVEDPKWTFEELEEWQKIKDENVRRKELERLQKIRDEITSLMSQNPQWTLEELEELKKIKDENARCKELERLQKIRDEIARLISQRELSQRQGG
jgi:DNA-binding transcriptional MerR regulator